MGRGDPLPVRSLPLDRVGAPQRVPWKRSDYAGGRDRDWRRRYRLPWVSRRPGGAGEDLVPLDVGAASAASWGASALVHSVHSPGHVEIGEALHGGKPGSDRSGEGELPPDRGGPVAVAAGTDRPAGTARGRRTERLPPLPESALPLRVRAKRSSVRVRFMRNLPRCGTHQGIPAVMSSTKNCKNGPVERERDSGRHKIRAGTGAEMTARCGRNVRASTAM